MALSPPYPSFPIATNTQNHMSDYQARSRLARPPQRLSASYLPPSIVSSPAPAPPSSTDAPTSLSLFLSLHRNLSRRHRHLLLVLLGVFYGCSLLVTGSIVLLSTGSPPRAVALLVGVIGFSGAVGSAVAAWGVRRGWREKRRRLEAWMDWWREKGGRERSETRKRNAARGPEERERARSVSRERTGRRGSDHRAGELKDLDIVVDPSPTAGESATWPTLARPTQAILYRRTPLQTSPSIDEGQAFTPTPQRQVTESWHSTPLATLAPLPRGKDIAAEHTSTHRSRPTHIAIFPFLSSRSPSDYHPSFSPFPHPRHALSYPTIDLPHPDDHVHATTSAAGADVWSLYQRSASGQRAERKGPTRARKGGSAWRRVARAAVGRVLGVTEVGGEGG